MKILIIFDFNINSFVITLKSLFKKLFCRNCDICSRNNVVWIFYMIKFSNIFISPWIFIISISNIPQGITPFDFVVNIFWFFRCNRRLFWYNNFSLFNNYNFFFQSWWCYWFTYFRFRLNFQLFFNFCNRFLNFRRCR